MRISVLNSIPNNRVISTLKNKHSNNSKIIPVKESVTDKYERTEINSGKKHPRFGFIDPVSAGSFLLLIGTYAAGVYKTNLDEKRRAEEEKRVKELRENKINEVSNTLNISREQAESYHDYFLKYASIDPTNDGNEKGLNAVMGYGIEKYRLASEVIAPLVANSMNYYYFEAAIPNGVLLYGPTGGGKTYIASKVCEHLNHFGIKTKEIELKQGNYSENAQIIRDAFKKAEEDYKEKEIYTVLNFTQDFDTIFPDRNIKPEAIEQIGAFINCADNCAQKGAVWIGTTNNPKLVDSAILRPGRADVKMPIGNMEKFAISDTIKYYLYKHDEELSANNFDYEKIINTIKEENLNFTPAEYELFIKKAKIKKPFNENITTDMFINEMIKYNKNDFPSLDEESIKKFKNDREYVESIDDETTQNPS